MIRPLYHFGVLVLVCPASMLASSPAADPKPASAAVVLAGDARFTVLTDRLFRMEWNPAITFEDRASFVFLNRRLSVPRFTTGHEAGWLILRTAALTLRHKEGSGKFGPENLTVEFRAPGKAGLQAGQGSRRVPGMKDTGNLRGTLRTLDCVKGAADLEPGLLSRDGWTNGCPITLVAAAQTGNRMELTPTKAKEEIRKLHLFLPAIQRVLPGLEIADSVRVRVRAHLSTIEGFQNR